VRYDICIANRNLDRVEILRDCDWHSLTFSWHQPAARRLDLPEVSLVAISMRTRRVSFGVNAASCRSPVGAARNAMGRVIFYGDKITDSMRKVIDETERRRTIQRNTTAARHHTSNHREIDRRCAGLNHRCGCQIEGNWWQPQRRTICRSMTWKSLISHLEKEMKAWRANRSMKKPLNSRRTPAAEGQLK